MGWQKPEPSLVWQAVTTYLCVAYEGAAGPHGLPVTTPSAVRSRLDSLRLAPPVDFFASPVFERDAVANPLRYSLRLGNRHYPHMKLVIDRSPDRHGHLFRADTHDAHCRPAPGSRDYPEFCQLMNTNRLLAEEIEAAWALHGIRTFKTYLREDLARRAGK